MAEPVLWKNPRIEWTTSTGSTGWTQITDVKSAEMPLSKAELANSVAGDNAETFFPGLVSAPVTVVTRQSFGAGSPDAEAWDRWNNDRKFKLRMAADNATIDANNPFYVFSSVRVFAHTPLNGQHGQLLENTIQMRLGSGGTVSRTTDS